MENIRQKDGGLIMNHSVRLGLPY